VLVEVVGGLIVAIVVAACVFLWHASRSRLRPLLVTAERPRPESWALALRGEPPDPAELVARDAPGDDVYFWLLGHGAVDYRRTTVRLALEGLINRTVVVREVRLLLERDALVEDTLVTCPSAGANLATLLLFDLDDTGPRAWEWREDGPLERVGNSPYFDTHNVTVSKGERHEFLVVARALTSRWRWRIAIDVEVGKRRQAVTVDDDGAPFVTTGGEQRRFAKRIDWAWYEGGGFVPSPELDF
jgi:hypothetical protein